MQSSICSKLTLTWTLIPLPPPKKKKKEKYHNAGAATDANLKHC